jgi:hypothetical protein
MRVPSPDTGRITAPGSSWLQSTSIVQRKRRPTSNVDEMTVLRARRGGTGSNQVTLRGGRRRVIRSSSFGQGRCASTSFLCGIERFYPHALATDEILAALRRMPLDHLASYGVNELRALARLCGGVQNPAGFGMPAANTGRGLRFSVVASGQK